MKLFYTQTPMESVRLASFALERCGIGAPRFYRTEHGKPRLLEGTLFFNLSHTDGLAAVAVSSQEVGLDAERRREKKNASVLLRLTEREREEDFFELWTAKEAYVKFKGETLASLLPRLVYERSALLSNGAPLEVSLSFLRLADCTLCVCTKKREEIEVIPLF